MSALLASEGGAALISSPLVGEEGPRDAQRRGKVRGGAKRIRSADSPVMRARTLRRDATDAEKLLWHALREKLPAAKFRRQVPLGPYFADFASHSACVVVEVDGGQHALAVPADDQRTAFLMSEGYRVLRFWNHDVMENIEGVVMEIAAALPPHPPIANAMGPSLSHKGRGKG